MPQRAFRAARTAASGGRYSEGASGSRAMVQFWQNGQARLHPVKPREKTGSPGRKWYKGFSPQDPRPPRRRGRNRAGLRLRLGFSAPHRPPPLPGQGRIHGDIGRSGTRRPPPSPVPPFRGHLRPGSAVGLVPGGGCAPGYPEIRDRPKYRGGLSTSKGSYRIPTLRGVSKSGPGDSLRRSGLPATPGPPHGLRLPPEKLIDPVFSAAGSPTSTSLACRRDACGAYPRRRRRPAEERTYTLDLEERFALQVVTDAHFALFSLP
jgi:hypothetical protein